MIRKARQTFAGILRKAADAIEPRRKGLDPVVFDWFTRQGLFADHD